MGTKQYYLVSAAITIRPLNSEADVQRAIQQSAFIVRHVRENMVSIFILERQVDVSGFYRWLAEADRSPCLPLETPQYSEKQYVPVRQSSPLLTLPRF